MQKIERMAGTVLARAPSRRILFLILSAILAANLFHGYKVYSESMETKPQDDGYAAVSKFMGIVQLIREKYVEKDKVTYDELFTNALRGMLRGLDPFSAYLDRESYEEMMRESEGSMFGGLGIHIIVRNHKLKVIAPMENSPAHRAGIMRGDVIMYIDDTPASGLSFPECLKLLQGPPGSKVTLTIHREIENLTTKVTIVREFIEPHTVKSAFIEKDRIGYLSVSIFIRTTAEDLDKELAALKARGMTALIIDLRSNPGGLLDSAVEVCSRFIEDGELIVYIEGRSVGDRQEFLSRDCKKTLNLPIAILVNDTTASAAEIFAGCMQDYKRAALIGDKTFGKGTVQSIMPLSEDSAIRLTTAKYYTPGNKVIHEHGIDPDIEVKLNQRIANDLYYQSLAYPGEVQPEVEGAVRDVQLERAIEILKGIRLFSKAE
ncbi:MAG: S41 family peptidase [Victivallales bacterium]|nr:S41 family peptidase [Victivallales bacterium]